MLKHCLVLLGLLSIASGIYLVEETDNQEFVDIYFIKAVSDNRVQFNDYYQFLDKIHAGLSMKMVVSQLDNLAKNGTSSVSVCDKDVWLHCGVDVLGCVESCRQGTLGQCIDCLGTSWKDCCPCVQQYVPKIPCA